MVLSKKELRALLKVPTTVEQAKQIKRRCEGLLEFMLKMKDNWAAIRAKTYKGFTTYEGVIGCPHCEETPTHHRMRQCDKCAWVNYPNKSGGLACYSAKFGGITIEEVRCLRYWTKRESAFVNRLVNSPFSALLACIRFLRGYIEWAVAVIKKGGVG